MLKRRNPFRQITARLAPGDIRDITVRGVDWDSSPQTFVVDLRLARGPVLTSGDFTTRAAADALAQRLRQALG